MLARSVASKDEVVSGKIHHSVVVIGKETNDGQLESVATMKRLRMKSSRVKKFDRMLVFIVGKISKSVFGY